MVADELSNTRSFPEGLAQMTSRRSQIFRFFIRGESILQIAESCGVSYGQARSQISGAVAELERKNPSALDAVRWQQYLMLMRVVDQAFAAFQKSAEESVKESTCQTIERLDKRGKLGLTGRSVTRRVRKDAGDVRFLEVAMEALRETRDLFKIGAEAESKLKAASPERGPALGALLRKREVRLTARWSRPPNVEHNLDITPLKPTGA